MQAECNNHTAGKIMNQFKDLEIVPEELEDNTQEEHAPIWRYRIFAILLLMVFLLPLLLSVMQTALTWFRPEVQPTPLHLDHLLHG
jgi:hypothetical protein